MGVAGGQAGNEAPEHSGQGREQRVRFVGYDLEQRYQSLCASLAMFGPPKLSVPACSGQGSIYPRCWQPADPISLPISFSILF